MKKIYVKNNYLIIENSDGTQEMFPKKDSRFSRLSGTDYYYYRFNNTVVVSKNKWQDFVKEDDSPFASIEEFEAFITVNTGNFNSGSAFDPQDYDLSDFTNDGENKFIQGTGNIGQIAVFNGTSSVLGYVNLFYISSSSRLGIGTSTPTSELSVVGSIDLTGNINSTSANFTLKKIGVNVLRFGASTVILSTDSATGSIYFRPQGDSASTNQVIIASTGIITTSNNGTSANWYAAYTRKNEAGQVKVNYTGLTLSNFTANVFKTFNINAATPTVVASPTTTYPNSTPNNYSGFFDSARGTTPVVGRLIENPIQGQAHKFRIQGTYSGKSTAGSITQILYLRLRNTVSGFTVVKTIPVPSDIASAQFDEEITVIADNVSIPSPNGYVLEVGYSTTDAGLSVSLTSITRFSEAKDN